MERHLDWDGSFNTRDLGGLPTAGGREIRRGSLVRSGRLDMLTDQGWASLYEHGVRTIVDLRNEDERLPESAKQPDDLATVQLPLDPVEDTDFWDYWGNGLHGTPLYYQPLLDRCPDRIGKVVSAVAHAEPGGVLVHCSAGRDRTGLIIIVLLALTGVGADDILADYLLSTVRLRPVFPALGMPDQELIIERILARENTTADELILSIMDTLDPDAYLRAAGLGADELSAVRARLLD